MLSIDLGTVNLGYAVRDSDVLDFGLFILGRGTVNETVDKLFSFVEPLLRSRKVEHFVVEQQVPQNHAAMQMMYCLLGMIRGLGVEKITIFPAREKFTKLSVPYNTEKKEHKKLSILIAETLIETKYPELIQKFKSFKKRDDISDALLMLFLSGATTEEIHHLSEAFKNSGKKVQTRAYTKHAGEYFPYINRSELDLSVLQILREGETPSDSCFIHACKVSGVFTDEEIDRIREIAPERRLPVRRIKDVARDLGVNFVVKYFDHTKTTNGSPRECIALDTRKLKGIFATNRIVRLILYLNHYMFDTVMIDTVMKNKKVVPLLRELIDSGSLVAR